MAAVVAAWTRSDVVSERVVARQVMSTTIGNTVETNPVTCAAQDQCHDVGTYNTSTGICSNSRPSSRS